MAKVTKQDWLDQALELLASGGPSAVTLQALLDRLNVSHGSFYHHFSNRQALTDAMLEHWEQTMTADILDSSGQIVDLGPRLDNLINQGEGLFTLQTPLENAIRSWAQTDNSVKNALQRVDKMRREHCQALAALVVEDHDAAVRLGDLVHAVFIGTQQNMPAYSAEETQAVYRTLMELVMSQLNLDSST
ncbi:MAG: TetR/AcrR family transcriptional regulator [Pseudomonadales bacterium]|nr:TetR/AcrR family transcriptional regulator [Pseudomonadales bacterium]